MTKLGFEFLVLLTGVLTNWSTETHLPTQKHTSLIHISIQHYRRVILQFNLVVALSKGPEKLRFENEVSLAYNKTKHKTYKVGTVLTFTDRH